MITGTEENPGIVRCTAKFRLHCLVFLSYNILSAVNLLLARKAGQSYDAYVMWHRLNLKTDLNYKVSSGATCASNVKIKVRKYCNICLDYQLLYSNLIVGTWPATKIHLKKLLQISGFLLSNVVFATLRDTALCTLAQFDLLGISSLFLILGRMKS